MTLSGLVPLAAAATVAAVQLPPAVDVAGTSLHLASCGVRDTFWIEHYAAGLYVAPGASLHSVRDPNRPKAVRLQVIEDRWLPEQIPAKWREALESELNPGPMNRLRGAFAGLTDGDIVTLAYLPGEGIDMQVNGATVVRAPGHGTIDAVLEAWAEGEGVSEKLERLKREYAC